MIRAEAVPVGTTVTYDDEPTPPTCRGKIVEPTAEELEHAKDHSARYDPVGPEAGDVLVEWTHDDEEGTTRAWESPSYLITLGD